MDGQKGSDPVKGVTGVEGVGQGGRGLGASEKGQRVTSVGDAFEIQKGSDPSKSSRGGAARVEDALECQKGLKATEAWMRPSRVRRGHTRQRLHGENGGGPRLEEASECRTGVKGSEAPRGHWRVKKGQTRQRRHGGGRGGRTQGGGGLGGSEGVRRLKGVTGGKRGTQVGGGSGVTGVKSASGGGLEH